MPNKPNKFTHILEENLTRPNLSLEARFQQYSEIVDKLLIPGEEIDNDTYEALGNPSIMFVGNPTLNTNAFALRPRDYQSIGELNIPGRSALLDFTGSYTAAGTFTVNKEMINVVKLNTVNVGVTRSDNLWVTTLQAVHNSNFSVYYAPVSTNKLHLRIVWNGHKYLEYPYPSELPPVDEEDLEKLTKAFTKIAKIKDEG